MLSNYFITKIASLLNENTGLPEAEIEKLIEVPPDFKMGDYAFPCYTLSKALKIAKRHCR